MEDLKWGILGPGKISKYFANDLALVNGSSINAVASRSIDRAETFAQAYQIENAYGDYQALFNDPKIDIVYIGTPHDSHLEYALQALRAGKHVLCEKPVAVNQKQVQKMVDEAREQNVFLMEALWSRFNPTIIEVLKKVKEGTIGELNYLNVDFSVYREFLPDSRMLNMDLAGGSLLDMGIYPIFLAYLLMGYPDEILSTAKFHETGADIQTSAIFKYQNGLANILSGFNAQSDLIAKINGSLGRIEINSRWHEAESYKVILDGEITEINLPKIGRGYSYEIMECMSCISKGLIESPMWSHKNSLDLISIMDKIRDQIGLKYPFE